MISSIERLRRLNKGKKVSIKDGCVVSLIDKSFPLAANARACNIEEFLSSL
jgi:hypothetical protein